MVLRSDARMSTERFGHVDAIVRGIGRPVEEEQGVLSTACEGLEGVELLSRAEDLLVHSLHAHAMS
jgi:hypothetical protein